MKDMMVGLFALFLLFGGLLSGFIYSIVQSNSWQPIYDPSPMHVQEQTTVVARETNIAQFIPEARFRGTLYIGMVRDISIGRESRGFSWLVITFSDGKKATGFLADHSPPVGEGCWIIAFGPLSTGVNQADKALRATRPCLQLSEEKK